MTKSLHLLKKFIIKKLHFLCSDIFDIIQYQLIPCLIFSLGMLIAGELYIHFKDESVKDQKFQEMLKSLSSHVPLKKEEEVEQQIIREKEPGALLIKIRINFLEFTYKLE